MLLLPKEESMPEKEALKDKPGQLELVMVTKTHLDRLERSSRLLRALEAGGVDNWEGYHHAPKAFYKEELGEDD